FVFLYFCNELFAYGYIVLQAEHIPYSIPRQSFFFFEQSQTLESLSVCFVFAQFGNRFQQSAYHTFLSCTAADNVCTDTVDGSIEVVKSIVYTIQGVATNDFAEQIHSRVVHDGYVV